jgi:hypothetical protein
MTSWPIQAQCDAFYGNPRGHGGHSNPAWEAANLVLVSPPFKMTYAGHPVHSVKIHRKCASSLLRVFSAIWTAAKHDQATIDRWGVSIFGGSYNFRLMRGSSHLSMHSYGCAIDLAPERFPMGSHNHTFAPEVIQAFANEGWVNLPNDRMHFQAARVSGVPLPKPAPVGNRLLLGVQKMALVPSKSTLDKGSIIGIATGFGAVLPQIYATFGTYGLMAAAAFAVCFLIQALLPVGTAKTIEDAAISLAPIAGEIDPALKPIIAQVIAGIKAEQANGPA